MATRTRNTSTTTRSRSKKGGTQTDPQPGVTGTGIVLSPVPAGVLTFPLLPGMSQDKAVELAGSISTLHNQVATMVTEAAGYDILDDSGFRMADETLGKVSNLSRDIEDVLRPYIDLLRLPLDQLYDLRRTILDPLTHKETGAEKLLKDKMKAWRLDEQKRLDEANRQNEAKAAEMTQRVNQQMPQPQAAPPPPPPPVPGMCPHDARIPQADCYYCYYKLAHPGTVLTGAGIGPADSLSPPPPPPPPAAPVAATVPQITVAPIAFTTPAVQAHHSTTSYVKKVRVIDKGDLLTMIVAGLASPDLVEVSQSQLNAWLERDPVAASNCPGLEVFDDVNIGRRG